MLLLSTQLFNFLSLSSQPIILDDKPTGHDNQESENKVNIRLPGRHT